MPVDVDALKKKKILIFSFYTEKKIWLKKNLWALLEKNLLLMSVYDKLIDTAGLGYTNHSERLKLKTSNWMEFTTAYGELKNTLFICLLAVSELEWEEKHVAKSSLPEQSRVHDTELNKLIFIKWYIGILEMHNLLYCQLYNSFVICKKSLYY